MYEIIKVQEYKSKKKNVNYTKWMLLVMATYAAAADEWAV